VPDLQKMAKKLPKRYRRQLRRARLLISAGYPRLARRSIDDKKLQRVARRKLGKRRYQRFRQDLDFMLERHSDRWKRLARSERRMPWNEGIVNIERTKRHEIYPPAYFYLARAAGRPHDVSPWWLISHMLQESRFKYRARSHAGALGPMQVLPRTGRRIAMRLGFPAGDFFEDRLYEPGVGLRHAAWYLAALRREYSGNVMLAIGAYNGGPRRMSHHLRVIGDQPLDVIIEEIGAHETRNYTRKVTDHLIRNTDMYADDTEREAILRALALPREVPRARGEILF
jgi:soluble lytic murein transglycosylase-like protein